MIKKQLFLYLFSFIFIAPVMGMDSNTALVAHTTHDETVTFLSNTDNANFPYIMRDIYNDTSFNSYASGQFVSNQNGINEARNNAYARGAKVHLTFGSHHQNKRDAFKVTKAICIPNYHAKITTAFDCSPSKGIPTKSKLLLGSPNESNATWLNDLKKPDILYNFESAILIENNIELTTEAHTMIQSQSPAKKENEKNIIIDTPEKISLYSSKRTKLNASWAQRLNKLAEDKSDHRAAYLETMNVNNKEIIDASIKAKKSGADVMWKVNRTALTKNGRPFLQQLDDAHIPVFVFEPHKKSQTIERAEHKKTVTIEKGDLSSVTFSNGNFTQEGDSHPNFAVTIPNNKKVTTAVIENFKRNSTQCIMYKDAIKLEDKKNEEKALKRKMEDTAKKSATKKQKVEK